MWESVGIVGGIIAILFGGREYFWFRKTRQQLGELLKRDGKNADTS
jgi:hypothetical protein